METDQGAPACRGRLLVDFRLKGWSKRGAAERGQRRPRCGGTALCARFNRRLPSSATAAVERPGRQLRVENRRPGM